MNEGNYIQVLLPLRLDWDPFYILEGARVGQRVKVEFAHREYVGVVSAVDVVPEVKGRILSAQPTALPPIQPCELSFWNALSEYYLCSRGEVYKAAYPSVVRASKPRKIPKLSGKEPAGGNLTTPQQKAMEGILAAFEKGKTVLLKGDAASGRTQLYLELARQTLAKGKSVLYLIPEIALSEQLQERIKALFPDLLVYHSAQSASQKRAMGVLVREQPHTMVLGTRSALFLPHHNLGLIVVDEEHDASYKQDSPAPRYQARESAILLAGIQGANVILGSLTPSLESLYNAETGLFTMVNLNRCDNPEIQVINISAETRKNGMPGSFSLKMLDSLKETLDAGEKALLVCRSKATLVACEEEIQGIFPDAPLELTTPSGAKLCGRYHLIAVIQADGLLGKDDFRADERALQLLQQLQERTTGLLLIQTREPGHPVFKALKAGGDGLVFLQERKTAGYPPLSRMIDIVLTDKNLKRLEYLSRILAGELGFLPSVMGPFAPMQESAAEDQEVRRIRLMLPRDKSLKSRKTAIAAAVARFEKERKYSGHIVIDVDPA